jgi:hypothetical protein
MPVPSTIADLSTTAASNSPAGTDLPSTLDDHIRALGSFIAYLRDSKQLSMEATVASAATTDIGAAASYAVKITGTTTITSFGTDGQGFRFIRFTGALTLTHNASSLILPGGANITTAAGDTCIAIPIPSGGGWYVSNYVRAAASVNGPVIGTVVATTSGTAIDITGIPSWAKRVTVNLASVSLSSNDQFTFQLGDSGGIETTGYSATGGYMLNGASGNVSLYTSGFGVSLGGASENVSGRVTFELLNASTNLWTCTGLIGNHVVNVIYFLAGSKALSSTLDRVRMVSTGAGTFDAGSVNILYE